MNYEKLKAYEVREFIRIFRNTYYQVKFDLRDIEKGYQILNFNNKSGILNDYSIFKKKLEREFKEAVKAVGLNELIYCLPYIPQIRKPGRPK